MNVHSDMPPPVDNKDPTILFGGGLSTSTLTNATNGVIKPKGDLELAEKYSRLKKRYFELDQKQKETALELQRSGERNTQIRRERSLFLDRIVELEAELQLHDSSPATNVTSDAPIISGAFPRSLMSQRSQIAFANNLKQAMNELDREDTSVDPMLTSRHVGPNARKRQAAEDDKRFEEEAREAKRPTRKTRSANNRSTQNSEVSQPPPPVASPPLVVTNNGTRLRIKPQRMAVEPIPPPQQRVDFIPDKTQTRSISPHSQSPISPLTSPDAVPLTQNGNMPNAGRATASNVVNARPSELQRQTKPKRLKAHTVTSKKHSIPMVPRDKLTGKPMLPLNVGIMTVVNLGEICMREHFHTERYIFPVGYEVTRRYLSTIDPDTEVVYHCTILDGGDGPKFQITAADMPDKPIIAGTATGAWSGIVRTANVIRNRIHSNSVSGPDYFGLGQNTIKHLIQELPGADRLRDYVWQNYVEGGPLGGRHAAVIPALPEEVEGNVQLGQYYPSERERERERERIRDRERERQIAESDVSHLSPRTQGSSQPFSPLMQQNGEHNDIGRSPQSSRYEERILFIGHEQPWIINEDPSTYRQRAESSVSHRSRRQAWPSPQILSPTETALSNGSSISTQSVPPTLASIMHAYPPPPAIPDFSNGNNAPFSAYSPSNFTR